MTLDWHYVEGLRLDEAMHPLTILATASTAANSLRLMARPLRLVVPWKYGFKGIKSIVRITLTAMQPRTTWNSSAPREYGFLANVNPAVDHPRWSQATEQRLGESGRRRDVALQWLCRTSCGPLSRSRFTCQLLAFPRRLRRNFSLPLSDLQFAKLAALVNGLVR